MSRAFVPAAARLAALAAQVLGWRPDEFWAATPADLALALTPLAPPARQPLTHAECVRLMEQER